MPKAVEGLIFGDFSADEWQKYFRETAHGIGIRSPPVEFYFDLEWSESEEQTTGSEISGATFGSSVAESPCSVGPTVPEDSGVEVGQESEQEVASQKLDGGNYDSSNQQHDTSTEGLYFFTSAKLSSQGNSETSPAVLGGGPMTLSTNQPEAGQEKSEGEKNRRRRRRRRPRHRSGSLSSSTSESDERVNNRVKAAITLSAQEVPKSQDNSSPIKHSNATAELESCRKQGNSALEREDTFSKASSSDSSTPSYTQEGSNEKISHKTDKSEGRTNKADNETQGCDEIAEPDDKNSSLAEQTLSENVDESKSSTQKAAAPTTWASLFKGTTAASSAFMYKVPAPQPKLAVAEATKKPFEEKVEPAVAVEDDEYARKLAETLEKVKLNFEPKATYLRGLVNRGNWCYINATLQALLACPPFFNMLKQIPPIKDRGQTSTPILDSMILFMHEFEIINTTKQAQPAAKNNRQDFKVGMAFEPTYVYRMLNQIKSSLSIRGRQEDAEEFLSCVLNGLHDEMLQLAALVKNPLQVPSDAQSVETFDGGDQEDKEEQDKEGDWEQVGPRNKSSITRMASLPHSFVSEIFGGYLRSSLHQSGLKESANVEPFFDLQLDIQNVTSIEDALSHLTVKEEVQGYTCAKTKQQVDASRRVTFEGLPKILVLHLKRFLYMKTGSQKLQKTIDYPLELNMSRELLSPNVRSKFSPAQRNYKLFAVVYHHGKNASGGHYTVDVHHPTMGWVRADDTRLKTVPINFVLKPVQGKDPYILYYRRTDLMP